MYAKEQERVNGWKMTKENFEVRGGGGFWLKAGQGDQTSPGEL